MYIQIKGFRSIQNLECEFHQDAITLISGQSGTGKSTLMNAVLWCLYGTLRNVRRFGAKSGVCMVKIGFGSDMTILRSKSPESLRIELADKQYTDKEAQDKIQELFGSSEKWTACCYLKQGSRNHFLECSPSDRLALLGEICFSKSNPDEHIEKIEQAIQEAKTKFDTENTILKRDIDHFKNLGSQFASKYGMPWKECLQNEHIEPETDPSIIHSLQKRLQRAVEAQTQFQTLQTIYTDAVSRFPEYKKYADELMFQKDRIQEKSCTPFPNITPTLTYLKDLEQKESKLKDIRDHSNLLKLKLPDYLGYVNLKYDENVEQEIRSQISNAHQMEARRRMEEIQTRLESLRTLQEINELISRTDKELENLKNIRAMKSCLEQETQQLHILKQEIGDQWADIESRTIKQDEYQVAVEMESKKKQRMDLLTKLGFESEMTQEEIKSSIDKRKRLIELQPLIHNAEELRLVESKINDLEIAIQGLGKRTDWISEKDLASKTIELSTMQNLLTCPKCSSNLRYENGTLVESLSNHSMSQNLANLIEISKKRIQWIQSRDNMQSDFEASVEELENKLSFFHMTLEDLLDFPRLENDQFAKIKQEILWLESLPSIVHTQSSQELILSDKKFRALELQDRITAQNILIESIYLETLNDEEILVSKRNEYIHERSLIQVLQEQFQAAAKTAGPIITPTTLSLSDCMKRLDEFRILKDNISMGLEIVKLEDQVHILESELENMQQAKDLLESQKKEITEIEEAKKKWSMIEKIEQILLLEKKMVPPSDDPEHIKTLIEDVERKMADAKLKIERVEAAKVLMGQKQDLMQRREELIEMNNKWISLSKIKLIAHELEHKRLKKTLQTIGDFANEVLSLLFDDPIKIDFQIYKTNKTTKSVKPSITYKFLYKGHEIDNLEQLSGGEGDRVSLAVTCAMFRFSHFPFLLLDEFASSLDISNKENAIQALKSCLSSDGVSKSILCISHDTVEGIYDHHIKFKENVNLN